MSVNHLYTLDGHLIESENYACCVRLFYPNYVVILSSFLKVKVSIKSAKISGQYVVFFNISCALPACGLFFILQKRSSGPQRPKR